MTIVMNDVNTALVCKHGDMSTHACAISNTDWVLEVAYLYLYLYLPLDLFICLFS